MQGVRDSILLSSVETAKARRIAALRTVISQLQEGDLIWADVEAITRKLQSKVERPQTGIVYSE